MKQMYKYALVRFMPFVETGEFANVGVLLCAPKTGFWAFKLAPNRFKRITDFFHEMDKEVYKVAISKFRDEMETTSEFTYGKSARHLTEFFTEITRPRQALIQFSNVRTALTDNPEKQLAALYDRYIHRDFVNEQYKEQQMVSALKKRFENANLEVKYTEKRLKVGVREVTIPLAAELEQHLRLIKPLAFDQQRPTQIFEHGESWFNRLSSILDKNLVNVDDILLPIQKGKDMKGERNEAFVEVKKLFEKEKIQLIEYNKQTQIMEFARGLTH